MRTIELLKSLTGTELNTITVQVSEGKRKSLQKLLQQLKKHLKPEKIPDATRLFQSVFGKPYTKAKDYLLRNELRLLNDIIYEFLVFKSFRDSVKTDPALFNRWLSRAYFDRKMKLFAADADGFIESAAKAFKMEEAAAMCALRTHWWAAFDNRADDDTRLKQIKQWQEYEKKKLLYGLRNAEYSEAFLFQPKNRRDYDAFGVNADKSDEGLATLDIHALAHNDWYARHLLLKKQYFQSTGSYRLNYCKQLYELSTTPQAIKVLGPDALIKSSENMAFCLGVQGKAEETEVYMKQAIILAHKYNRPVSPNHICNYIITLYSLHKFDEAIQNFNRYQAQIVNTPNYIPARIITSYGYLYMENTDKALALLPPLTGLLTGEVIESRCVYLVAFIQRKQYDLAVNEARNLKRMLSADDPKLHKLEIQILDMIQTWVKHLARPGKNSPRHILRLKNRIESEIPGYRQTAGQSPVAGWFFYKLGLLN